MSHERIQTSGAPAAIGPYSQAMRAGAFVFCAGQVGLDPVSGQLAGSFEDQVEQTLDNVGAVLAAAGLGFGDVVKTTCFLVDLADFQVFNERYGRRFGDAAPARSTVAVAGLPRGARVEIEVIAHRSEPRPADQPA